MTIAIRPPLIDRLMDTLRWLRIVGDTVFAVGAVLLVTFVGALATGHAYRGVPAAHDD